ncbi:hypothetical protein OG921_20295 [Aldersonia sp. NBC_00410]|uniref:hypothetical protein n=1 Tax=Aldersonia sp. NBC_00410 TaxID=2975954 RepID=UPI00225AFD1F|nr:hypothetical protein [Aldersonia sp. NBC_00410]MCX5045510.1 hypothetical protein [Aldersonia sp. NBC_00410]
MTAIDDHRVAGLPFPNSVLATIVEVLSTRGPAILGGLAGLTAAVFGLATSFEWVAWSPAQHTVVATEAATFWALVAAVTAHYRPGTKKQPVAVAGTVTAFASTTLSLGIGFSWWQVNEAQNASLVSLVVASVAVVSALIARSGVTAELSPGQPDSPSGEPGMSI